jgi:PTH1 family peptidyl-tRNA hydrolase
MPDYVLSKFAPDEQPLVAEATGKAADAATDWVRQGIAATMNKYNA